MYIIAAGCCLAAGYYLRLGNTDAAAMAVLAAVGMFFSGEFMRLAEKTTKRCDEITDILNDHGFYK